MTRRNAPKYWIQFFKNNSLIAQHSLFAAFLWGIGIALTANIASCARADVGAAANGTSISAQVARDAQDGAITLPGYAARVRGEVLEYHSPDPDVTYSLLVRNESADRSIAWETAPVPATIDADAVRFVWMFGIDVDSDRHTFTLDVDGRCTFAIHTPQTNDVRDWTIEPVGDEAPNGASLRFRATMIDRFDDLMGYAILTLPRSMVTPSESLTLSITGESAGSNVWYMTFQEPVAERARLSSKPALLRGKQGQGLQPVTLSITHLGPPTEAVIETSFAPLQTHTLELGGNRIELMHGEVSEPTEMRVDVSIDGTDRYTLSDTIEPVRHWTVNLVQHTHTDVGYTRPQTEILPEHLRYIDTALEYCDKTDDYPDAAKFRWTCEASWAVREYLESRTPAQIDELRRRVNEGRIEITGMFLNMSEMLDEASIAAYFEPLRMIESYGLPVTTGMQNDVNGAAWSAVDLMSDLGVKYLTMGQNTTHAMAPFDFETSFWWVSPSGNRLLAYRAAHYQTGNFWGTHTGKVEVVEDELLRHLTNLDTAGYPFDRVAVQHSGYPTDNAPPSTPSSDLVRDWNEKYVWPQLRCSLARELPEYVEANHADEIPVKQLAWPDWWTDGFGSAARETAAARVTQAQLVAVEGLLAMETAMGLDLPAPLAEEIDDIRDDLLFYGEHTFGAAESITEPLGENSMVQWMEKSAYAWDAVKRAAILSEGAMARLVATIEPAPEPRLLVVNTLGHPRSGLLELYVDHELMPLDQPFRLLDESGVALPVQLKKSRAEGSYWYIHTSDIPAMGWKTYRVEIDPIENVALRDALSPGSQIENEFYRIAVDNTTGAITSMIDRESGRELVDHDAPWKLGQLIYETLANRVHLEVLEPEDISRSTLTDVVIEGTAQGPVFSSLFVRGELPSCDSPREGEGGGGVRFEVRLFHAEKRVELHYTLYKQRNFDPEGIYVAFPFQGENSNIIYETLGGIVDPATDILPGGASDWQTMQGFAAVQSDGGQVVISSDEVPLVQLGDLNLGKFQPIAKVEHPHLYSWVMNNYWTTNFLASQEGEFLFSYALTSGGRRSRSDATRFGFNHRVPLLGRVFSGSTKASARNNLKNEVNSILSIDTPSVALISARPDRHSDGIILYLREVEGREATIDTSGWGFANGPVRISEVDALGRDRGDQAQAERFAPCQTKFVLVEPM